MKLVKAVLLKTQIYVRLLVTSVSNLGSITIKRLSTILSKARNYRRATIIVGTILALLMIVIVFYVRNSLKTKTYYIAYIGRYQKPNFDRLHEIALRKYVDELNADLSSVKLELKIFNNEQNNLKSKEIYGNISGNDRFVAVIDNTWGSELQSSASIIRENNIPVIAINADKQNTNFANHAVFLGHGDNVPQKITDFSKMILEKKHIIFIAEENFASKNVFDEEFRNSAIEITQFSVSSNKVVESERETLFKNLDLELANWHQRQESPTVIINTHADWGVQIINYFDQKLVGGTILGGPYISSSDHASFGKNKNGNRLIMLTNPSDTVTNKIHQDLQMISISDPEAAKSRNAQLFVKRCLDAISIIRGVFSDEPNQNLKSTISRSDFINFFRDRLLTNEYIGKYDLYSFDDNLLLLDETTFEEHIQGEESSYPKQLNLQREVIPNVYFGIEIINISNIDITEKSFHADFFYWLKYDKNYEVEKYIQFRNERNRDAGQEIAISETSGTTIYKLYKKSADFGMDVDFGKFPFDIQELKIELALIVPSDRVLISFDHEGFKDSKKKAEEFSLNDWYMKDFYVTVDNFITTSSRGGQSLVSKKPRKFKTLTVRLPVRRHLTGPFVTIILPLIVIGLAAIATLYIQDNSFSEISGAIFLSIVTYSIGFAEITPRSNTLTIADMLFYFTFFIVLLTFLKVILFSSSLLSSDFKKWASGRVTLIATAVFAVYCLVVMTILISGLI